MSAAHLRCALYTRKSSEEGLEQAFNSLHAQRDACDAYVKSQAAEGWRALSTIYDDGGYSGGSMERPALQTLLADIAAGKIDVVVVYKIDRLTRSLADFARIVELFDRHNVSFVSVTQAFNTTTSMGRLTLNVLLSFAQFEREVTGERIRDKIAASKARGMWMGGLPPLGYDVPTDASRALVVNHAEAATVREIFSAYLDLRSVHALERRLRERGVHSKAHTAKNGRKLGGLPFSRGALFHLLRNRIYLGQIVHRGTAHPGGHPPIVDAELFASVQQALDANVRRHRQARSDRVARAKLTGKLFDADGDAMSPTFAHGARGQVYRYYVSAPLQQGRRSQAFSDEIRRVSATALEQRIEAILHRLLIGEADEPFATLERVEIYSDAIELIAPVRNLAAVRARLEPDESAQADAKRPGFARVTIPIRMRMRGGRTVITGGSKDPARRDMTMIQALRAAHRMVALDKTGAPLMTTSPTSSYARKLVRLAFLAPDIQESILGGRQPVDLTLAHLLRATIPASWRAQRELLDFPVPDNQRSPIRP